MVSTVSLDDEVAHNICCFDLLQSRKLRIFRTLYHERGSGVSLNRLTLTFQSWFQQLDGIMKLCTIYMFTLYHERGSLCGHHIEPFDIDL